MYVVKKLCVGTLALALLLVAVGCDRGDPFATDAKRSLDTAKTTAVSRDVIELNGFTITYLGRDSGDGETTFSWHVVGTGEGSDIDYFALELPECAGEPSAVAPDDGYVWFLSTVGLNVVKWRDALGNDDPEGRVYSMTLPGDVAEGVVMAAVNTSEPTLTGFIKGPCGGFEITGNVFTDSNFDGLYSPDFEGALPGVVVELVDADAQVQTATTGPDGSYLFSVPYDGSFTVRIDTLNYPDAFNGELAELYTPTTPLEQEVTVGPDVGGIDFGFELDPEEIIREIRKGELEVVGEDWRFWKIQFKWAVLLGDVSHLANVPQVSNNVVYTPEELFEFVAEIKLLYLRDPFLFPRGQELQHAYKYLRRTPRDEVEELRRELFTAELNFVAGGGVQGDRADVTGPLLAWGEALVREIEVFGELEDEAAKARLLEKADSRVEGAIEMFRTLNTGGGGLIDD